MFSSTHSLEQRLIRLAKYIRLGLTSLCIMACQSPAPQKQANNGAFVKATNSQDATINRIVSSGELIIATISGPDTYFDYQGVGMGLQYALAENFAATLGVGVRVELSNDTTTLIKKLETGDVDLIALQLPKHLCQKYKLTEAGVHNAKLNTSWAIKSDANDLAQALTDWYGDGIEIKVEKQEKNRLKARTQVRRQVRAPYISREKGIISTYDHYFKQAALHTGWDWRLIAAQCYQESGFDPNAISWAGAKGLMQLMPATANEMGLAEEHIFQPAENIAAAVKVINKLQGQYRNIQDPEERIKFTLASYNGGKGHINDAQALTRKYGGNPYSWDDVSYYVQNLSNPRFYRDPVVRYGYMIGDETFQYVQHIMARWKQYGGRVRNIGSPRPYQPALQSGNTHAESKRPVQKPNRYSKQHHILTPEEMEMRMQSK